MNTGRDGKTKTKGIYVHVLKPGSAKDSAAMRYASVVTRAAEGRGPPNATRTNDLECCFRDQLNARSLQA